LHKLCNFYYFYWKYK